MEEWLEKRKNRYYDYSKENMIRVLKKSEEMHVISWKALMMKIVITDRKLLDQEDIEGRRRAHWRAAGVVVATVTINAFISYRMMKRLKIDHHQLIKNRTFLIRFALINIPMSCLLIFQHLNYIVLVTMKHHKRYPELARAVKPIKDLSLDDSSKGN